jgi:hypothetical protein
MLRSSSLGLKKGKYIFETNYRNSRIKKGLEAISSQDEVFHDFKAYLGEIYGEIKSDSGQSIIFVHKGEYYEVDVNELQGLVEEIKKQITQSNPPDDMVTSGRTPTTMPPVSMKPRS